MGNTKGLRHSCAGGAVVVRCLGWLTMWLFLMPWSCLTPTYVCVTLAGYGKCREALVQAQGGVGTSDPIFAQSSAHPVNTDSQFFTIAPPSNHLRLPGESYAGIYVPNLARAVVEGNAEGQSPYINLVGYLVGNGGFWCDVPVQVVSVMGQPWASLWWDW